MSLTTQKKKKTGSNELPEIEYFREVSERFLYWNNREEAVCKEFADQYRRMMNALTSDTE